MKIQESLTGKKNPVQKLEKYIRFQEISYYVEMVGITLLFVFLILGLCGVFGGGKLSWVTNTDSGQTINYERFVRKQKTAAINVFFTQGISNDSQVTISIDRDYHTNFKIKETVPEALEETANDTMVVYKFANTASKGMITFYIDPLHSGSFTGKLLLNEKEFFIKHFVYF